MIDRIVIHPVVGWDQDWFHPSKSWAACGGIPTELPARQRASAFNTYTAKEPLSKIMSLSS
jgi:hypothetical protein